MAVLLFDLPQELMSRILCFLDLPELAVLQQTHSRFRRLIQDSQGLQYRFAASLAGVRSNEHSTHTASERLVLLKNREQGWLDMNIDFQKSIANVRFPSGIYDLTGGIYFVGDLNKRSIHYCQLPSRSSDTVSWNTINVDKALVVDIGLSVYEHNLIAILTYSPHPTIPRQSIIEIALLELSTGKPHPLAKDHILFIGEGQGTNLSIDLQIVGEHLVLIMTRKIHQFNVPDTLRVYEWKTGTLKMDIERPCFTYHDFIFLSPNLILLPNHHLNTLDVWELPAGTTPAPTESFLSLALPSLSPGSSITFRCRCEPNPIPGGTPHLEGPFHPDPKDAIVVLHGRIQGPDGVSTYSLFVHRSALLRICTNDRPEDDDGVISKHIPGKQVRAWAIWGPRITRVFHVSRASQHWITLIIGQRAIVRHGFLPDDLHSQLLDFNPSTVKKAIQDWSDDSSAFDPRELELDATMTTIPGIQHPIRSQLPYVAVDVPFQDSWLVRFKGLLLYEEGFLILPDRDEVEEKIEILHVGVSANSQEPS